MDDENFYGAFFAKLPPGFAEAMDLTLSRLRAYGRVEDSIRRMARSYKARGCVSKYDCFRACGDPLPYVNMTKETWHREALGQWSEFCESEVGWYDIEGTHPDCVRGPNVDALQRQVNRALEARGV